VLTLRAEAAALHAQLMPLTGEVRLHNPYDMNLNFVFYSVRSPAGTLNASPAVWHSITDNYDASGNGSVDSRGEWIKIAAEPVELAEGVLLGPGGTLAAQQTISLGRIWNQGVTPFPDLTFEVIQLNGESAEVVVEFGLNGDFNQNGIVDAADYVEWRTTNATQVVPYSGADGNGDGIVNDQDYLVWRAGFGAVLRPDGGVSLAAGGAAAAIAAAMAIPEPSACLLFALGIAIAGSARYRRRVAGFAEFRRPEF
jgi:hypothetical protein